MDGALLQYGNESVARCTEGDRVVRGNACGHGAGDAGQGASTAERDGISIDILSDTGNRVAEQIGLVFELPQVLRPICEKFGIDIPAFNGDDRFKLPVPATYIIGQDGMIVYDFVNADYAMGLEPAEIVEILAKTRG